MWSRRDLKVRAKAVLRTNYWKAFLISLVIAAAGGSGGSGGSSSGRNNYNSGSSLPDRVNENLLLFIGIAIVASIVIIIIIAALRIFLGYPLEVGGRRYFIKSAEYSNNKKCFSFAFYGENYKGIVLTMLLKGVQNFLWFLLFIIPGIVKYYAYRMVPYILADNPNIGYKRAIQLSKEMTNGHKFDIFILDLSFIGWYLLGLIALVIGMLFVMPYQFATEAELYLVLRQNALENGLTIHEELLLYKGTL
jgi:hypothetical protein